MRLAGLFATASLTLCRGNRRIATKLAELEKRSPQRRELPLTDEAAKTALVMPFKFLARLHCNSPTTRYVGTFAGKVETRHPVAALTDIYRLEEAIVARLQELAGTA